MRCSPGWSPISAGSWRSSAPTTARGWRSRAALAAEIGEGDSVAVNGVCLTATAVTGSGFAAEVMNQTLSLTSLGRLQAGEEVNLELPLRAADRLGGHIVQGHVDGAGEVSEVISDGFARRLRIAWSPICSAMWSRTDRSPSTAYR